MLATILLLAAGLGHVDALSIETAPCFCTADFNPVCYKGKRYSNKCFAQCAGAPDAMITAAPASSSDLDSTLGCPDDSPPKSWPMPMRGLAAFVGVGMPALNNNAGTEACAELKDLLQFTFGFTCTTDLGSSASEAILLGSSGSGGKRALRRLISPRLQRDPRFANRRLFEFWKPKTWENVGKEIAKIYEKSPKENLDNLGKAVGAIAEDVGKGFEDAGKAIKDAFEGVGKDIVGVVVGVGTGLDAVGANVDAEIDKFFAQAGADFEKAIAELAKQQTLTGAIFEREFAKIGNDFTKFFGALGLTFDKIGQDFIKKMENIGKFFEKAIADILNGAGDLNGKAMTTLLQGLSGTLRNVCPKTCVAPGDRCAPKPEQPECPPDQGCICTADVNYVCDNKGNLYTNACKAECAGYFGKLLMPIPGADAFSAPTCPDCHLYKCPANAKRKPNRLCYDTFGDCDCNPGYTRNDKAGTCERDCICTKEFDPVCYAGFLYNNECLAKCAGAGGDHSMHSHTHMITKPTPGAGPFDDPSCPQDCTCTKENDPRCWKGKLYNNPCLAECAGATTGQLTMPDFGRRDACKEVNTAAPVEECKNDFECPKYSKRKPNRKCYDTVEDCYCADGYEMKNGKCYCTNKYECPKHSKRKKNRKCYNNFDDCECDTGFFKDGNECEFKEVTVVAGCPAACQTCKDGGGSHGRKTEPHCKYYCSKKNFCGVSNDYKNGGTDCTRCEGGANVPPPPKVTPSPTSTPTIDRFVETSLNPGNNQANPPSKDDGDKLSKGAIAAIAVGGVAFLAIAGVFFYRMGKADGGGAPPPQDLKPVADLGTAPVAEAATSNPTNNNGIAQV